MNIPRQAPARIPKKLYLFPTMLLPKGKENLALTANTCGVQDEQVSSRKTIDHQCRAEAGAEGDEAGRQGFSMSRGGLEQRNGHFSF